MRRIFRLLLLPLFAIPFEACADADLPRTKEATEKLIAFRDRCYASAEGNDQSEAISNVESHWDSIVASFQAGDFVIELNDPALSMSMQLGEFGAERLTLETAGSQYFIGYIDGDLYRDHRPFYGEKGVIELSTISSFSAVIDVAKWHAEPIIEQCFSTSSVYEISYEFAPYIPNGADGIPIDLPLTSVLKFSGKNGGGGLSLQKSKDGATFIFETCHLDGCYVERTDDVAAAQTLLRSLQMTARPEFPIGPTLRKIEAAAVEASSSP